MPAIFNDLWAHVEGATNAGVGALFFLHGQHNAAVEVTHTDEPMLIEQYVTGLQVTMYYTNVMHEFQRNYELQRVTQREKRFCRARLPCTWAVI